MDFGIIWLIALYLLFGWIAVTIGWGIRRFFHDLRVKTHSKIELELLQKEELKKRIALLEKELKEKEQTKEIH